MTEGRASLVIDYPIGSQVNERIPPRVLERVRAIITKAIAEDLMSATEDLRDPAPSATERETQAPRIKSVTLNGKTYPVKGGGPTFGALTSSSPMCFACHTPIALNHQLELAVLRQEKAGHPEVAKMLRETIDAHWEPVDALYPEDDS